MHFSLNNRLAFIDADVLILMNLKNLESGNYVLYPSHYLSTPALSWSEMLSMTKVELELFSDTDMYFFFQKAMRWCLLHA